MKRDMRTQIPRPSTTPAVHASLRGRSKATYIRLLQQDSSPHYQSSLPEQADTSAVVRDLHGEEPTEKQKTTTPNNRPVRRAKSLLRRNKLDEADEHTVVKSHLGIKPKKAPQPSESRIEPKEYAVYRIVGHAFNEDPEHHAARIG